MGGFSQGITLGFFNSSNRARVLARFFLLIIHNQRGKLHFGPHGEKEENKRKKKPFRHIKSFNTYHGPYCMRGGGGGGGGNFLY